MARGVFAALLAVVLLTTPTHAQTGRILLDMTSQALPGSPSGHCLYVDAGHFVIEGHLVGNALSPTRFTLAPAMNVPSILDLTITTTTTIARSSIQVAAGVYCYTLSIEGPESAGDNVTDRTPQADQLVAVRLIWLPVS